MQNHEEIEKLRVLGKKYLDKEGQGCIEQHILDERLDLVRAYLLGAVDGLYAKERIPATEVNEVYEALGLSAERRAKISTRNRLQ